MAVISIAGLMVLSSMAVPAQEPSLADVARMNRAARQPKKAAALVIDDEAVIASGSVTKPALGPGHNTDSVGTQQPSPPLVPLNQEGQKPVLGSRLSAARDEDECARLKKELEDFRAHEQGWKLAAARYQEKLAAETSEFRRTMYQDALENDRRNVSFYRQKINDTESKLAEAEAAAAKSSASAAGAGVAAPPQ